MKKTILILILILLMVGLPCFAQEQRLIFDIDAFERGWLQWAIEDTIQRANNDVHIAVKFDSGQIVADMSANLDLGQIITKQGMIDKIQTEKNRQAQAVIMEEQNYQILKSAIKTKLGMTDIQFNNFIHILKREVEK